MPRNNKNKNIIPKINWLNPHGFTIMRMVTPGTRPVPFKLKPISSHPLPSDQAYFVPFPNISSESKVPFWPSELMHEFKAGLSADEVPEPGMFYGHYTALDGLIEFKRELCEGVLERHRPGLQDCLFNNGRARCVSEVKPGIMSTKLDDYWKCTSHGFILKPSQGHENVLMLATRSPPLLDDIDLIVPEGQERPSMTEVLKVLGDEATLLEEKCHEMGRVTNRSKRVVGGIEEYEVQIPFPDSDIKIRLLMKNLEAKRTMCALTVFEAAVQMGEILWPLTLYKEARETAVRAGKLALFAQLLWKFTRTLALASYKHVSQDVVYFAVATGEVFEALKHKRVQGAERRAIIAYKFAALYTVDHPTVPGTAGHAWNCLGVALKRAGEFDMAERAYRRGLAVNPEYQTLYGCFYSLLDARTYTSKQNKKLNKGFVKAALKQQSLTRGEEDEFEDESDPDPQFYAPVLCSHCGNGGSKQSTKLCACKLVRYCDKACQKADWKAHKAVCSAVKRKT